MPTEPLALHRQQDDLALLGLLQLVSPALPIGAFAFSQGLESAFELGWVEDEASLARWLSGVLGDGLTRCELPVLARLQTALAEHDSASVAEWDAWLGSPVIWLLLGAGVLGVAAVALLARRAWRKRQEGIKQVRAKSRV